MSILSPSLLTTEKTPNDEIKKAAHGAAFLRALSGEESNCSLPSTYRCDPKAPQPRPRGLSR